MPWLWDSHPFTSHPVKIFQQSLKLKGCKTRHEWHWRTPIPSNQTWWKFLADSKYESSDRKKTTRPKPAQEINVKRWDLTYWEENSSPASKQRLFSHSGRMLSCDPFRRFFKCAWTEHSKEKKRSFEDLLSSRVWGKRVQRNNYTASELKTAFIMNRKMAVFPPILILWQFWTQLRFPGLGWKSASGFATSDTFCKPSVIPWWNRLKE
jgi:hypothetical protein